MKGEKRILASAFQNRKKIAVKQSAMANQTGFFLKRGKQEFVSLLCREQLGSQFKKKIAMQKKNEVDNCIRKARRMVKENVFRVTPQG